MPPNPHHFSVDFDGVIHYGVNTTDVSGAMAENNRPSIMILKSIQISLSVYWDYMQSFALTAFQSSATGAT